MITTEMSEMIFYGFNKGTNIGAITMKYFNTTLFLLAILIHTGNCYTLETLPADSATVDSAFKQVAANTKLQLEFVNGPIKIGFNPNLSMPFSLTMDAGYIAIYDSCSYLFEPSESTPLNLKFGILRLKPSNNGGSTECKWKIMPDNPFDLYPYNRLLADLTNQQIQLDRNETTPFINPRKSKTKYILLNTITPLLGNYYINKKNPLITKFNYNLNIVFLSLYEITAAGLITYGVVKDNDDSIKYINGGLLVACVTRLFGIQKFKNISDYNTLANTPYNLSRLKYD